MSAHNKRLLRASRWTGWEVLLLGMSIIMIAFPALVTGYALVSPTDTLAAERIYQAETSVPEPTQAVNSPTPTNTRTPTATSEPSATPTDKPALTAKVKALNSFGYTISTVKPGETFRYYIEVAYELDSSSGLGLIDRFPNEVTAPSVLNVINGTCEPMSGLTLQCEVHPRSGQVATVVVEVTMGDVANNTPVKNEVEVVSFSTNESVKASVTVVLKGGSAATATSAPTSAVTETPVQPTATSVPATSVPATSVPATSVPATSVPVPTVTDEPIIEPTATDETVAQPRPPRPTNAPPRSDLPPSTVEPTPTNPPMLPVTVSPVETSEVPSTTPTDAATVVVEPTATTPIVDVVPTAVIPPVSAPTATNGGGVAPTEPPAVMPAPVGSVPSMSRPVLSNGARGDAVIELQSMLNAWIAETGSAGIAPLALDGMFGAATEMAVRTFQAVAGLTVDGIVGAQTWTSLEAYGGGVPPVAPPVVVAPQPHVPAESAPAVDPGVMPTDVVQTAPVQIAPTPTFAPTMVAVGTPIPTTAPRSNVALRFHTSSGIADAAPGDLVMFTITLRHAGRGVGGSAPISSAQLAQSGNSAEAKGETLRDLMLLDEISPALEIFAVNSIGIDVRVNGHRIEASRSRFAPGDAAVIVIGTRVRDGIDLPTIANQASLRYSMLGGTLYSNVAEVRVNGVQPAAISNVASIAAATTTPVFANAVVPSPTLATTDATPSVTPIAAGMAPADLGTRLPTTSGGGVPFGGIVLLGLTLFPA